MRLLLDTHTLLWWLANDPRLSAPARTAIANPRNDCFVSLASCWELAIKSSLGKIRLAKPVERFIPDELAANDFQLLPIEFRHVARVESLEFHHRDPFDRLLAAQAQADKLTLLSADELFDRYGVKRVW